MLSPKTAHKRARERAREHADPRPCAVLHSLQLPTACSELTLTRFLAGDLYSRPLTSILRPGIRIGLKRRHADQLECLLAQRLGVRALQLLGVRRPVACEDRIAGASEHPGTIRALRQAADDLHQMRSCAARALPPAWERAEWNSALRPPGSRSRRGIRWPAGCSSRARRSHRRSACRDRQAASCRGSWRAAGRDPADPSWP